MFHPQKFHWRSTFRNAPARIRKGAPAVVLGVLLNTLAASSGLLVFPSAQKAPAFGSLQVQAMSIFIMSTIVSQLTLTLGGSLFPGALGSMLIEALPLLRKVASDIQDSTGKDSPQLIPTVLAAFVLTSLLVGFCFLVIGILKLGRIVSTFITLSDKCHQLNDVP